VSVEGESRKKEGEESDTSKEEMMEFNRIQMYSETYHGLFLW